MESYETGTRDYTIGAGTTGTGAVQDYQLEYDEDDHANRRETIFFDNEKKLTSNDMYKSIAVQCVALVGLVVFFITMLDCENITNDFCKVCNNQNMCSNEPCASKGDIKQSGVGYQTCWSQRYFCLVVMGALLWAIVLKVQAFKYEAEKADKADREQKAFFEEEERDRNSVNGNSQQ